MGELLKANTDIGAPEVEKPREYSNEVYQDLGESVLKAIACDPESKWAINKETTIETIFEHLDDYLGLESAMLTYALKQKLAEDPETVNSLLAKIGARNKAVSSNEHLAAEIMNAIENLETFETKKHVFLLQKDKWERDRTVMLGDCGELNDYSIVTRDLTAFDKEEHTEVNAFSSKEALKAEEALLKPNGYQIPESWEPILKGFNKQYKREGRFHFSHGSKKDFRKIAPKKEDYFMQWYNMSLKKGWEDGNRGYWSKKTSKNVNFITLEITRGEDFDYLAFDDREILPSKLKTMINASYDREEELSVRCLCKKKGLPSVTSYNNINNDLVSNNLLEDSQKIS